MPSLKKRQTTRWNTLPSKGSNSARALCGRICRWARGFSAAALLASGALAGEPTLAPALAPTVAPVPSPLDRLKERSASERWQELRTQYSPTASPRPVTPGIASDATAAAGAKAAAPTPLTEPALDLLSPSLEALETEEFTDEILPLPRPTLLRPVPGPYVDVAQLPPTPGSQPPMGQQPPAVVPPGPATPPSASQPQLPNYPSPAPGIPPEPLPPGERLAPMPDNQFPGETDTIFRPITQIQPYYDYSPTGKKPHEYLCPQPSNVPDSERFRCPDFRKLPGTGTTDRYFSPVTFNWEPSNLFHYPLYFEDISLERYGHQWPVGVQPFVSLGRFGVQFVGLPYQMALDPACRPTYALGYYRPGDVVPELFYQIPINLKAAAAAGGVYTGLIFLFP